MKVVKAKFLDSITKLDDNSAYYRSIVTNLTRDLGGQAVSDDEDEDSDFFDVESDLGL